MDASGEDVEWLIAIENAEDEAIKESKQQAKMAEQMEQHRRAMMERGK